MTFRKVALVLFILFSIFPSITHAQNSNAGFVPGNIWYSVDPFEEGDKIKIYTVIFNPDTRELSGVVNFFDGDTLLGKKDFTVAAKGVKDVSINWTVTVGNHKIFAKIENAKFLVSKGKYEDAALKEDTTEESKRNVSKKIAGKKDPASEKSSVENIGKTIEENTPLVIAKPIIATAHAIENFRLDINATSSEKKEAVQKELKDLDARKNSTSKDDIDSKENRDSIFLKPFKYLELFFFQFLSFVTQSKLAFYLVFGFIVLMILRFVISRIFFY